MSCTNEIALYIKTTDETIRICFGGKQITSDNAYKTALAIKEKLIATHTNVLIQDDYRSPQQAAASDVGAKTS